MKLMSTAALALGLLGGPVFAWEEGAGYLKLEDGLDRPSDGYCLDVAGSGGWVDFTVPLNAHNCKGPYFYPDQAVRFDQSPGPIRFPAYGGCVTALGRDGRSLPMSALTLKPCAVDPDVRQTPFASEALQTFVQRSDGRIALNGTHLCLTVGAQSDVTFSLDHRWRPLFLDTCETADPHLSVWAPFTARQ